ncbi:Bug family tripartite tricarboxylate transporter substrate binding protein [Roseomonas sp. CCTCC AB2023176]|uniref:Bug family tripartite tricarboxylate transporter substrate binding protein n=1 Tax=Roseomonas sp. CCTCC AB2023176 TaxID=3342640 RepID=UPI0035D8D410
MNVPPFFVRGRASSASRTGPSLGGRRGVLLGGASILAMPSAVRAQDYTNRPVRIVVPFPAGGTADLTARLAARVLQGRLGQPVVVENRAGAGGNIAAEHVARSTPDGHTLLLAGQAILAINAALYPRLSYDPAADFAFLGMAGISANVLISHPAAAPARTIGELIAVAKARPGAIAYGSNGPGSLAHLTVEVLAKEAGISFLHVPYGGAAPLLTDLLAGRIGFCLTATPVALPPVRDARLLALAVTTGARIAPLPEVPTLVESGFPALDAPSWFGLAAPAATPAPILARLRAEMDALNRSEAYRAELAGLFSDPMPLTQAEADALLTRERRTWTEAVRSSGARAE